MSLHVGMLSLVATALVAAAPAAAQVRASIHVGQPVVLVRPAARVIHVEHGPARHAQWYARRGFRPSVVWFDGHRFLHPASPYRPWYREVVVFERRGRFVLPDARPVRFDRSWQGGGSYAPEWRDEHDRVRRDRDWDD